MKKSISKPLLFFLILTAFVLIFLSTYLVVKTMLLQGKSQIEHQLSRYLKHKINIKSIIYIPPNFLILNQVAVNYAHEGKEKSPPLFVKSVRIVFSLGQLTGGKKIVVNKVVFVSPRVDYNKYQIFFKENIEGIIKAIKVLARDRPLKLVFEDAAFIFGRKGSSGRMLLADTTFQIDLNQKIQSLGSVRYLKFRETDFGRKVEKNLFAPGFSYKFNGALVADGLVIERVVLESANFQAAFKGEIIKSVVRLKGFLALEKFYGLPALPNKLKKSFKKLAEFIRYGRLSQKTGVLSGGINILDINCLIKVASLHITAQNVEFCLNNVPVRIQGEAAFRDQVDVSIKLSTFANQCVELRENNPQRLDINLKCSLKEGKTSGESDIIFLSGSPKGKSLQRVKTSFGNLSAGFLPDTRLKIRIEKIAAQYSSNAGVFNFLLSDLNSMFNFINKGIKFVKFNAKLYDGTLSGYVAGDVARHPPEINCSLSAANVSAWQLDSLLLSLFGAYRRLPAKLQGKIDGQFTCDLDYVNHPEPRLTGKAIIRDGYLDNVKFFVWLGEFFGLPDLKQIKFSELYMQFESTQKVSSLKNIKLKAENIFLEGNFLLKNNEFVSSKISIVLAREFLRTSSKFNVLLALMDKKGEYFNFDFQLSGVYSALNFKWQKSVFKQKLKKMLPGFIERGLERKVERAIQAISSRKE
ncbi:MAG: hypothetical protein L6416_01310 [Candidatus Omnitrophica bacterium]|nr:hypothetical protein [Candidatus Omnitrophota bacterium]